MEYLPISLPFFLLLSLLFAAVVALVLGGVLRHISLSLGVRPGTILLVLLLCLIGSGINIPILRLPGERVRSGEIISYYGMHYVVPVVRRWPGTVIAVNVGGAVIPVLVSLYLLVRRGNLLKSVIAVVLVSWAVHQMAQLLPGVGIAVPSLLPPVFAALVALALSQQHAASIAYVAGSLGTLIGADLLNLGHIRGLGAPVASIGGAGKYDAIFLTGLLAVLIAGIWGTPPTVARPTREELSPLRR